MFSAELEAVLRGCGWSPERSVEVRHWVDLISHKGFTPFAGAVAILKNFGGLSISPPQNQHGLFCPAPFTFDPVSAASGEWDRIAGWQHEHRTRLCPLAASEQVSIILYTDAGQIVEGWERHFDLLGTNLEEALDLLVFARRYPVRFSEQSALNWWELEKRAGERG
jgi:hypothetical protein